MNRQIGAIAPSVTLGITSRAKQMVAAGQSICSFAGGEPDFDTPENVKRAAIEALEAGHTKYAPASGLPALREAIVDKLLCDNGLSYDVSQVVVSNGAKHSLFNVFLALLNPGDEVIVPTPYWLSYPEMVRVAGAVPVFVETTVESGYKLTAEQLRKAVTPKTVAIVLNSPSNPIGIVYSREETTALCEAAVACGLTIVSDEIYEKLIYEGVEHVSPASLSDEIFANTVTVNGLSKACSMTGWRLGYIAGPKPLVAAVIALQSHSTSSPNTFAQYGGVEAIRNTAGAVAEMVRAFDERRMYLYSRLTAIEGITCVRPQGAFYVLPDISSFGLDSVSFAERLLNEKGVAVVPGAAFGADRNVRLSYACSMENIKEGLDRLECFIGSL